MDWIGYVPIGIGIIGAVVLFIMLASDVYDVLEAVPKIHNELVKIRELLEKLVGKMG